MPAAGQTLRRALTTSSHTIVRLLNVDSAALASFAIADESSVSTTVALSIAPSYNIHLADTSSVHISDGTETKGDLSYTTTSLEEA